MITQVFVTVGTTKFEKLVQSAVSQKVINSLRNLGCKRLILQIGHGTEPIDEDYINGIHISIYRFKDSIREDIYNADLVISHGGAGCCLETLEAEKPLIAVINEDLMNNHQVEVATKLSDGGYIYSATCDTLSSVIENSDFSKLKVFPKRDPTLFAKSLDIVMGFS